MEKGRRRKGHYLFVWAAMGPPWGTTLGGRRAGLREEEEAGRDLAAAAAGVGGGGRPCAGGVLRP